MTGQNAGRVAQLLRWLADEVLAGRAVAEVTLRPQYDTNPPPAWEDARLPRPRHIGTKVEVQGHAESEAPR